MNVLRDLFGQAAAALPEKGIRFEDDNDLDGIRGQIIGVRAKISAWLSDFESRLCEHRPSLTSANPGLNRQMANPRHVLVIHGRNDAARNALFAFLRSLDLSPIEWETAVEMTGTTSPYVGEILDAAFTQSQAAIVLLTGDDVGRLGTRYWTTTDPKHERDLTPQARPNVLFEAGMAFGRYPHKTIIVELGQTRPFSDILGRHIVHLTNSSHSRLRLISRLRTARCEVQYEGREDWLSEGDFEGANVPPDFGYKPEPLPTNTPSSERQHSQLSTELGGQQVQIANHQSNPVVADGENNCETLSPDDFAVRIVREEGSSLTGFTLNIVNWRLSAIEKTRLIVRSARSFDSRKGDYRDGRRFNAFDSTDPDPIEAGCSGKSVWFVHKASSRAHLLIGSNDQHPLFWPDNDTSNVHRWLISFEVLAFAVPTQGGGAGVQLKGIKQAIVLTWDKSKNEFFIRKAGEGQE